MRSWSCAVVLLACVAVGWAEPGAPYLVLHPAGHTGRIESLAFATAAKVVASAGTDCVVRVWDTAVGELLRTIPLPAAQAHGGSVDCPMALSSDGSQFAAALGTPYLQLWIIDVGTGSLVQRIPFGRQLAGNGGLAFSPSGRLIALGVREHIVIYEVATGRLIRDLPGPTGRVRPAIELCWSPQEDRIAFYSWGDRSSVCVVPLAGSTGAEYEVDAPTHGHSICWSPSGRAIVCASWSAKVAAWDAARLEALREGPDLVQAMAFSGDGERLWASMAHDAGHAVHELDGASLTERRQLPGTFGQVLCLAASGDLLAVGENEGNVEVWDTKSVRLVQALRSPGRCVFAVAWSPDGSALAWRTTFAPLSSLPTSDTLNRSFDLGQLMPAGAATAGWRMAVHKTPTASAEWGERAATSVVVHRPGLQDVVVNPDGDTIGAFSLTPDNQLLEAGHRGVGLYDQRGQPVRRFVGATGHCKGLATSPDNRYLLSGGDDQTLRIWRLHATEKTVPPLLSLFVGDNGDWIAWTQEGYYACTPGAERWIAWQRDYPDRMPEVYPVYQFRQQFYRPDVISLVLKHGDVSKALAEADAQRGRPGTVTVAAPTVQAPPSVTILTPKDGATVTADEIDLRAKVVDPNGRLIRRVHFTVNGRSIDGARFVFVPIRDEPGVWATRAPLSPGECTLSVVATNDVGAESLPASIKVTCQPAAEGPPPSLYVLAVGVGKYAKPEYSLKYAGADAIALAEALRAGAGRLYQKVGLKVLSDDQATRAGVLDGLEWLSQQVTQRDLAVVFMAGHGVPDVRNDYQFLPFDGDVEKLISTGVKWTDIRAVLSKLPGRVILALDTCHSAGVTGARALGPRLDYTNLLREAATDEVGLVTLSSCMPHEVSLENEAWQHGAFTKAMIEALQGQADNNHDGIVSLAEVDAYVSERVKELTGGRQHPTSQRPATIRSSLPLALCEQAGK
ncbi:MAG: caspase family protein [Armatimonadetes bacterium]|nr:caspase family protein [Armatimonadota bacterium]